MPVRKWTRELKRHISKELREMADRPLKCFMPEVIGKVEIRTTRHHVSDSRAVAGGGLLVNYVVRPFLTQVEGKVLRYHCTSTERAKVPKIKQPQQQCFEDVRRCGHSFTEKQKATATLLS